MCPQILRNRQVLKGVRSRQAMRADFKRWITDLHEAEKLRDAGDDKRPAYERLASDLGFMAGEMWGYIYRLPKKIDAWAFEIARTAAEYHHNCEMKAHQDEMEAARIARITDSAQDVAEVVSATQEMLASKTRLRRSVK